MATIYEVSKLAGVSLATVSRVMNGNAKVREVTRQKVMKAIKELNYHPNTAAKSLASNRTNSVGILVSELHGPFYGTMMSVIEAELRAADKHVILTAGHSDEKSEKDGVEFLINRNCDALILHVEAVTDEYLIELSKGSTPFVLINRLVPELEDVCITLNNHLGGYLATRSLIEMGHKKIAYISGPLWKTDAKSRYNGHKQALEEFGLELEDELLFPGDFQQESGARGMDYLLKPGNVFTAVVCANDEMAAGAMNAARENELSIPEDLSIIGFDNSLFTSFTYPKLSTIDYPIDEMSKVAARMILNKISKTEFDEPKHEFDPTLVMRDSVANITKKK